MTAAPMTAAWCEFLGWALEQPDLREAFVAETGRRFDEADGVEHFALWATASQWGAEGVPTAFLNRMADVGYQIPTPTGRPE